VTIIYPAASAQSPIATLHLIVHELPALLVVPVVNRENDDGAKARILQLK
jgi:hypothetical protein